MVSMIMILAIGRAPPHSSHANLHVSETTLSQHTQHNLMRHGSCTCGMDFYTSLT